MSMEGRRQGHARGKMWRPGHCGGEGWRGRRHDGEKEWEGERGRGACSERVVEVIRRVGKLKTRYVKSNLFFLMFINIKYHLYMFIYLYVISDTHFFANKISCVSLKFVFIYYTIYTYIM